MADVYFIGAMLRNGRVQLGLLVATIFAVTILLSRYYDHQQLKELWTGVSFVEKLQNRDLMAVEHLSPALIEQLAMDDERLINYIRKFVMEPPSDPPYNLSEPNKIHYSQAPYHQSTVFDKYFNHKRNGTFVEAGAYDGEDLSNSLFFEKSLGWTGVLVEPNALNQRSIRQKRRRAHFLPGCLAGAKPTRMRFECPGGGNDKDTWGCGAKGTVGANETFDPARDSWCFPLYSVLLAANITRVDYLVLDLEGFELTVIKAIPFDKVEIKILQIEANGANIAPIDDYFKTNLPQYQRKIIPELTIDIVFEHKTLPI